MRLRDGLVGIGFGGFLAVAATAPAAAQAMGPITPGMNGFQPLVRPDEPVRSPSQVPPALPGATPGRGAAPADKSVADLPPNDALFDAINRGDIAEARDAINRGADLNAQNVLGMTPLELSIDLSRNDITFLLLSLRGAPSGAVSAKAGEAPLGTPLALASAPPVKATKPPAKLVTTKPAPAAVATPKTQQFAGSADPGQPDPQAGFLGFGRSLP